MGVEFGKVRSWRTLFAMLEELDNDRGHGETSILSKAMAWTDLREARLGLGKPGG